MNWDVLSSGIRERPLPVFAERMPRPPRASLSATASAAASRDRSRPPCGLLHAVQ